MPASPVAWLAAHKAVAMAGAGAVGLGVMSRRKKAAGPAPSATPVSSAAPTGNAVFDSTGSDVYNSLEPQLEVLRGQIANLANQPPATTPAATPPAASEGKFTADFGRNVWAVDKSYAGSLGADTSHLTAPTDYQNYGLLRFGQQEYAQAHSSDTAAQVPGLAPGAAGFTVGQSLAEQQAFLAGRFGTAGLGTTI